MVVLDATLLMLMLRPESGRPIDSSTGQLVDRVPERLAYLVLELEKAKSKIIVPTPALSEVLVRAGVNASQKIVEAMNKAAVFSVEPFDTLAAIEVAAMTRNAIDNGDKKDGSTGPWAKVKYDRQIVAIAKVHKATIIYSDDAGVVALGKRAGISVLGTASLQLPPEDTQHDLFKDFTHEETEEPTIEDLEPVTEIPRPDQPTSQG